MTDYEYLIDTRFYYGSDNPFPEDKTGEKKRKLKKFIGLNPNVFTEVDYLVDNRFVLRNPMTRELMGAPINGPDITHTEFTNKLKSIILNCPCSSKELKTWASKVESIISGGGGGDKSSQSSAKYKPLGMNDQLQLSLSKILEGGTMYDMYSERTITYNELRSITLNIARSLRDPKNKTNDVELALENEERRKLINVIHEFKNVTVISPYIEDDIGKMTIEQLKTIKEKCERLHSQFKVGEALKSGFTLCSVAYDTMFPEGIPISKTKRLQFGGIGEEIKNKLLDNTKTVGFSFSRFLQKHNINITDEMTFLIAMGEILTSKAKIVNAPPKKNKDPDDDESANDVSNDDDSDDEEDSDASKDASEDVSDDVSDDASLDVPPELSVV